MYYRILRSLNDLVGESGVLRLPSYIFDIFVFDDIRLRVLRQAQKDIVSGERVLITGKAGTGKTALMAIILKNLFEYGYGLGAIFEDATMLAKKHEEQGIILFFDDIIRLSKIALRSIIKNNPRLIVATIRAEELRSFESKLGKRVSKVFKIYKISPMSEESIEKILLRIADKENIRVDEDAKDIVVSKSGNLPIYIWQLIRDLKVNRKDVLDREFAERIPHGMLEYVDDILWKVLDDHEEKFEILLTLRILADMPNYEMHQDLMNTVFAISKSRIHGKEVDLRSALLSDIYGHIVRYLLKTVYYSFRLPHDSWVDVLSGKSKGVISSDILRINSLFPREARRDILSEAIKKCEKEIIERILDEKRKEQFYRQIRIAGIALGEAKIGAFDIIIKLITTPSDEIRDIVSKRKKEFKEIEKDPKKLGQYILALSIYGMKTENDEYINEAKQLLGLLLRQISREDAYVANLIHYWSISDPEKATYNLRKLIDLKGSNKIEEFIRMSIMNFSPRHISDIVLSTYWASPVLFEKIFLKKNEELLYILDKTSPSIILREIQDIARLDKEIATTILNNIINIVKNKASKLSTKEKLELVESVSSLYKYIRKIIFPHLSNFLILTAKEMSLIAEENMGLLLDYIKNIYEIDPKLTSNFLAEDYIKVFELIINSEIKFFAKFLQIISDWPQASQLIESLIEAIRTRISSLDMKSIYSLVRKLKKLEPEIFLPILTIIANRLVELVPEEGYHRFVKIFEKITKNCTRLISAFVDLVMNGIIDMQVMDIDYVESLILEEVENIKCLDTKKKLLSSLVDIMILRAEDKNYYEAVSLLIYALQSDISIRLLKKKELTNLLRKIRDIPDEQIFLLLYACGSNREYSEYIFDILGDAIFRFFARKSADEILHFLVNLKKIMGSEWKNIKVYIADVLGSLDEEKVKILAKKIRIYFPEFKRLGE